MTSVVCRSPRSVDGKTLLLECDDRFRCFGIERCEIRAAFDRSIVVRSRTAYCKPIMSAASVVILSVDVMAAILFLAGFAMVLKYMFRYRHMVL